MAHTTPRTDLDQRYLRVQREAILARLYPRRMGSGQEYDDNPNSIPVVAVPPEWKRRKRRKYEDDEEDEDMMRSYWDGEDPDWDDREGMEVMLTVPDDAVSGSMMDIPLTAWVEYNPIKMTTRVLKQLLDGCKISDDDLDWDEDSIYIGTIPRVSDLLRIIRTVRSAQAIIGKVNVRLRIDVEDLGDDTDTEEGEDRPHEGQHRGREHCHRQGTHGRRHGYLAHAYQRSEGRLRRR